MKSIFTRSLTVCLLLAGLSSAQAQIKVFQNGNVAVGAIGTTAPTTALQVKGDMEMPSLSGKFSIANTSYGSSNEFGVTFLVRDNDVNKGMRLFQNGDIHFYSRNLAEYATQTVTKANQLTSKCWVVESPTDGETKFCVLGDGSVYSKGKLLKKALIKQNQDPSVDNPLGTILGLGTIRQTTGTTKQIGLNFDDLLKMLPEATAMMQNERYIDYDVLVPVLVEAIKAQNNQIVNLTTLVNKLKNPLGFGGGGLMQNGNGLLTQPNSAVEKIASEPLESSNVTEVASGVLKGTKLLQNQPNPFNQSTSIGYVLIDGTQSAQLMVFDMQGTLKLSKNLATASGAGSISVQANELTPGMYLYSLVVNGNEVETRRMILTQ